MDMKDIPELRKWKGDLETIASLVRLLADRPPTSGQVRDLEQKVNELANVVSRELSIQQQRLAGFNRAQNALHDGGGGSLRYLLDEQDAREANRRLEDDGGGPAG